MRDLESYGLALVPVEAQHIIPDVDALFKVLFNKDYVWANAGVVVTWYHRSEAETNMNHAIKLVTEQRQAKKRRQK